METRLPNHTFDDFVQTRTARAKRSAEAFNRTEKLDTWLRELDALYNAMEGYLRSYLDSGQITVERRPVQLREELLGTYDAEELAVSIGNDEVVARPIGTLLIGSSGRVDLSGPQRTRRIVLLEKGGPVVKITVAGAGATNDTSTQSPMRGDIDHRGWYLVTQPPAATATALDEDSFRDAIMDVSSG